MTETKRLMLREMRAQDAKQVHKFVKEQAIADWTIMIPHPYPDGLAEKWIAGLTAMQIVDKPTVFAITLKTTGELIGVIGLVVKADGSVPDLGYWLGVDYWGQGYMSEAVLAMLNYGFSELQLRKISACHFMGNLASERVLKKSGFHFVRNYMCWVAKWDKEVESKYYEIIK